MGRYDNIKDEATFKKLSKEGKVASVNRVSAITQPPQAQYKNLVIDGMSIMHLLGMEIDYKKDIFGSILHIENPNVTSSCGCGESFNVF